MDRSGEERADPTEDALSTYADERRSDDDATAERVEVEWAATSWHTLVTPSGTVLELRLVDGTTVVGRCVDRGRGWCLVDVGDRHVLVMLNHVVSVTGLGGAEPRHSLERGAGWVFRRWAREHAVIAVHLANGSPPRGRLSGVLSDAVMLLTDTEPSRRVVIPLAAVLSASGPKTSGPD